MRVDVVEYWPISPVVKEWCLGYIRTFLSLFGLDSLFLVMVIMDQAPT